MSFGGEKGCIRIRMALPRDRIFSVRRDNITNCKLNQLYIEVEVEK